MPNHVPGWLMPLLALALFVAGWLLWRLAPGWDAEILALARLDRADRWLPAVVLLTRLGGLAVLAPLLSLIALAMLFRGQGRRALWLVLAFAAGRITIDLAKHLFGRERPPLVDRLDLVSSASFPSAHAAGTMLAGALILLLFPARRALLTPAIVALILAIGWSRLALAVHWPGDVIGGFGLGLFCAGIAALTLPPATRPISRA